MKFKEQGFYSNIENVVPWQTELLEMTFGDFNFKLE